MLMICWIGSVTWGFNAMEISWNLKTAVLLKVQVKKRGKTLLWMKEGYVYVVIVVSLDNITCNACLGSYMCMYYVSWFYLVDLFIVWFRLAFVVRFLFLILNTYGCCPVWHVTSRGIPLDQCSLLLHSASDPVALILWRRHSSLLWFRMGTLLVLAFH